ncbi:MAG: hypothetical protein LBI77_00775 [Puniceicoccales bacterium]|jgi:hypothetical protein|nr:hypothetical protein [Puniceicoccales bacterium]
MSIPVDINNSDIDSQAVVIFSNENIQVQDQVLEDPYEGFFDNASDDFLERIYDSPELRTVLERKQRERREQARRREEALSIESINGKEPVEIFSNESFSCISTSAAAKGYEMLPENERIKLIKIFMDFLDERTRLDYDYSGKGFIHYLFEVSKEIYVEFIYIKRNTVEGQSTYFKISKIKVLDDDNLEDYPRYFINFDNFD